MQLPTPIKFSSNPDDRSIPHDYGDRFEVEHHSGWSRIAVGPSHRHIEILLALLRVLPSPYGLLWVLVTPASDHEPARYQSPYPMETDDVVGLLRRYHEFFEEDGRHHIWVMNTEGLGQIIYDNHNILYYYGPIEPAVDQLSDLGFTEGEVRIPTPHIHGFNPANADVEDALYAEFDWIPSPLVPEHDAP